MTMMNAQPPDELFASHQGGSDMEQQDHGGAMMMADGLMHEEGMNDHAEPRRSHCRWQRFCCRCAGVMCLALVVFFVAVIAASGGFTEDDMEDTEPLLGVEYGTINDQPPGPAEENVPAMAPVHTSFDQPSIAVNDPVGDRPSVAVSGDTTDAPTTAYQATLPVYTQVAMRDPKTAQSQAWEWLTGHPDFDKMEDWRKKQLLAMASFYYAYNGDNWSEREKKNWLSYEFNECQWGSFAASENECQKFRMQILRLEGQDQSVKGSTPLELYFLKDLERLEIFDMKLVTKVDNVLPSGLAGLPVLDRIRLSSNKLSGTMPTYLADFGKLTSLSLRSNDLTGELPTELGLMTNLKYLTLYQNKLEGTVPTELARLTNLVALSLYENNLSGSLPASLCALTSLQKLEVDCQKTACPMECDCVCKDPKLIRGTATPTSAPRPVPTPYPTVTPNDGIVLGLPQHSLDALAQFNSPQFRAYAWLINHPMLEKMHEWRKEQLFGLVTFYHAFSGVWTNTERNLWLNYDEHECDWGIGLCDFDNRFLQVTLEDTENVHMVGDVIPREISMLPRLEDVELYGLDIEANMSQMLPLEDLASLPLLTLNLQGNRIYGSIPTEIASLKGLRNLSLARNHLNGTVPSELGLLQDLKHLTLHENTGLKGQLPSELGGLSQLETLWLDRTGITGHVPMKICNIPSLQTLRVDCDKLTCPQKCHKCVCFSA